MRTPTAPYSRKPKNLFGFVPDGGGGDSGGTGSGGGDSSGGPGGGVGVGSGGSGGRTDGGGVAIVEEEEILEEILVDVSSIVQISECESDASVDGTAETADHQAADTPTADPPYDLVQQVRNLLDPRGRTSRKGIVFFLFFLFFLYPESFHHYFT